MTPSARAWHSGLLAFSDDFRRAQPLATVSSSSPAQAAERAILAAHLTSWIEGDSAGLPDSHAIAFTTSDLGILLTAETLARHEPLRAALRSRLVAVREIEYRLWTKDHADPSHALHVNHWSWIKAPVPRQRWHEFRRHPLQEGEDYWLHRTGTTGPGAAESRQAHLWKWTGHHAVLLEPFVRERIDAL